jgi:hypothetical protein
VLDEKDFARRVSRLAIQSCVPQAFRAAARLFKKGTKKDELLNAADLCEREPTADNARAAREIANSAAADADADAAADAYADADAAAAAAYAAAAAAYAAYAAAAYADAAAAYAAYAADAYAARSARDTSLADFAEGVVQILIEMKAPGCEWLYLTEEAA